jgi:Zn ribbon nucleic-acid-binding protein
VDELNDAQLRESLIAALTCPQCNTLTLLAEPDGAEGAWCGMCGWSRSTTLPVR